MCDRWFSKEELQQLPFAVQKDALAAVGSGWLLRPTRCWNSTYLFLTRGAMDRDALDGAPEQDTAGKPEFLTRLNEMHSVEPQMREQTGITAEMTDCITRAFAESKLAIWEKYLSADDGF